MPSALPDDAVHPDQVNKVYQQRRTKHASRLAHAQRVRDVLTNNINVVFKDVVQPGEEPVVGNLVNAAARTIAQRVGRMPRISVDPENDSDDKKREKAEKAQARLYDYSLRMNLPATRLQAAFWLVTHDMAPLVVTPSVEYRIPVIEVRDPMTCYPGTVWPHKPHIVDVLFADKMSSFSARSIWPEVGGILDAADETMEEVLVAEYFTSKGVTTVLLEPALHFLDFYPNPCPGQPMVVLTRGFSPDLDFHGQFDHVVGPMIAQAKLFAIVMSYAEQQVSSETVVVGEIVSNNGRWATGPGAVNEITPMPGASASKLTNNMSVQVFNELDRLERAIRLGGGFPAQLSGEPVASIATGRGLEQLSVTVDDNVAYWQTVLDDAFMRALGLLPPIARIMGSPGAKDFGNGNYSINVRSQSGADPAETVRLLQFQGAGDLSRITVMDRLPEVDSPEKELARIDSDTMRQTLVKALEMQVQTGQMQPDAVAEIIRRRRQGDQIEDIYDEIRQIQAQQEQEAAAQNPQQGQDQGGQAPSLQDLLNPTRLAGRAGQQGIQQARTAPQGLANAQGQRALAAPTPGGQAPGPPGVPA